MSAKVDRGCKRLLKALNLLWAGRHFGDSREIVSEDPCPDTRRKFYRESPWPFSCQGHVSRLNSVHLPQQRSERRMIWWHTVTVSSPRSALLLGTPRFLLNESSCQKHQHKPRITVPGLCETELNTWFQATQIKA